MMRINEVAKLTGVTARTLHYYDEIGLLTPGEVTEAGYRPVLQGVGLSACKNQRDYGQPGLRPENSAQRTQGVAS